MLEKIVNSMLHGNFRTKLFLWSVTVLAAGAAIMIVSALALGLPMLGLGGAGVGLVGFVVSQSVSLNDLQKEKKKKSPKAERQAKGKGKAPASSAAGNESRAGGQEEATDNSRSPRKKREREKAQFLASMDAKKLKKLMKKHKVDQIHVKVMIDSFPERKLEQVPAFMWKTDKMLHFLTMAGQADEFEVPLSEIKGILLVKNVPAFPDKDYMPFKYSNYMTKMFQPYLPEYSEVSNEGELAFRKNTFRIEPGIQLTNTSMANLRKVLLPSVAFLVDDKVIASKRFNEYFKELYRTSLLCKNNVIDQQEYKELMVKTLDALLEAPIPGKEFVNTLYDLNKYHLIPKEMVAHYSQKYRELNMNKK